MSKNLAKQIARIIFLLDRRFVLFCWCMLPTLKLSITTYILTTITTLTIVTQHHYSPMTVYIFLSLNYLWRTFLHQLPFRILSAWPSYITQTHPILLNHHTCICKSWKQIINYIVSIELQIYIYVENSFNLLRKHWLLMLMTQWIYCYQYQCRTDL